MLRSLYKSLLGFRRIKQIPLEIGYFSSFNGFFLNVVLTQLNRNAETGLHRALGIGGNKNQTAGGRRTLGAKGCAIINAGFHEVVAENPAQRVILDLADISTGPTQRRDASQRIRCRAAGSFDLGTHCRIELFASFAIDQRHDALIEPKLLEKRFRSRRNHIHDGVADTDYIIARVGHLFSFRHSARRV